MMMIMMMMKVKAVLLEFRETDVLLLDNLNAAATNLYDRCEYLVITTSLAEENVC